MMRQSTYEHPHTFEEAKQWLDENPGQYDYEVKIGNHSGALMSRETYLASVADHSLMDYDGMGNQVSEDGNVLGSKPGDPGWIKPSGAANLLPETKYVLWYNK